jgi:hypothetical protein
VKSLSVFCDFTAPETLGDRRLEVVAAEPLGDLILETDVAGGGASPCVSISSMYESLLILISRFHINMP